MRGAKSGTQRVSSDRRFIGSIVLSATILLGFGAASVTTSTHDTATSDSTVGVRSSRWQAPRSAASSTPAGSRVSFTSDGTETAAFNPVSTNPQEISISAAGNLTAGGIVAQNGPPGVTTYQETSASVTFRGSWSRALHPGYLGRRALSSNRRGAMASLRFTGTGISWIGPTGPTRGKAKIYVDGRYVKTVDTYSRRFVPSRVLYSATYATERQRTFAIVALGTKGHPTIAVDALAVRSGASIVAPSPASKGSEPASTPTSTPTETPNPTPNPTPSPTPAPSPTPVPSPTPTPTQTPSTGRPFPAPVTTRTVNVPSSIDATGSTDVTSALNSFVSSVPNGSVIAFPANGTFKVTQGIYLRSRSHLILEGNGSTLRLNGSGGSTASSGFKLENVINDIAIRNFTVIGNNPNTTTVYNPGTEYQAGVNIHDGARIELANLVVKNVYGDGVYVAGKQTSPYRSSDNIWIHDSTFDYIGRMGLVFNAATNSIAERNYYSHIGMFVLDLESNYDYEAIDNVTFRNNTVGSYGHTPVYTNWFFACSGNQDTAVVRNVYVTGNTVTAGAPINSPNNTSSKGGLATYVGRGNRLSNIQFTDNTTTKSGTGPALYFSRIDGLRITGNVQPVAPGTLASINDSTGVVYQP